MNVMSLLEERAKYPLDHQYNDTWLIQLIALDEEFFCIVSTENVFKTHRLRNSLRDKLFYKYHLTAMFDLMAPYGNTSVNFFLYVFSKKFSSDIAYGIYRKSFKHNRMKHVNRSLHTLELIKNLPDDYVKYLNQIDFYLSSGICPQDTSNYEFGSFPSSVFSTDCWNPGYYSKNVQNAYAELNKMNTIQLNKIAQVIFPGPLAGGKKVLLASLPTWKYPMDYNDFREGHETTCALEKGDIVLFNHSNIFLVHEQPLKETHVPSVCVIIRLNSTDFCSEYLYYFLKNELTAMIIKSLDFYGGRRFCAKVLKSLPIVLQEKDNKYYKLKFYTENFPYSYIKENPQLLESENDWLNVDVLNIASDVKPRLTPYFGEKEYIFISYSHKDKNMVLPIIRNLYLGGYRIWYDEGIDPGTEWDKNIAEHIINCGYFIAFISENYLNSSNCKDELSYARELDKNRFLVYLEKLDLPPEMQMRLGRIQNIHKYMYESDELFYEKLKNAKDLYKFID